MFNHFFTDAIKIHPFTHSCIHSLIQPSCPPGVFFPDVNFERPKQGQPPTRFEWCCVARLYCSAGGADRRPKQLFQAPATLGGALGTLRESNVQQNHHQAAAAVSPASGFQLPLPQADRDPGRRYGHRHQHSVDGHAATAHDVHQHQRDAGNRVGVSVRPGVEEHVPPQRRGLRVAAPPSSHGLSCRVSWTRYVVVVVVVVDDVDNDDDDDDVIVVVVVAAVVMVIDSFRLTEGGGGPRQEGVGGGMRSALRRAEGRARPIFFRNNNTNKGGSRVCVVARGRH
jgi:hypothetical protein